MKKSTDFCAWKSNISVALAVRLVSVLSALVVLFPVTGMVGCGDDSGSGKHDAAGFGDGGSDGQGARDASIGDGTVRDGGAGDAASSDGGGGQTDTFAFLAYGDSRAGGSDCEGNRVHIALVNRMLNEADVAFVSNMGDMITGYADTTCFAANGSCTDSDAYGNLSQIVAPLANRQPPAGVPASFIPVIGNHDDGVPDWYPDPCGGRICDAFDLTVLINHSTPNNDVCGDDYPGYAYYSFTYGGVAFFVLHVNNDYFDFFECNYPPDGYSSCRDYCKNGPHDQTRSDTCWNVHQYDWLAQRLAAASSDPTVNHIVVFQHAPVYTSFDDHPAVQAGPDLAELYDQYHVQLVMNGHNHTYERTVPIQAGQQAADGTVYITTSGGGVEMYEPAGDWFTAASSDQHHYVRVDVTKSALTGKVVAEDGSVLDQFTIQ